MFEVTPAWQSAFPGAHVGVLAVRDAANPSRHPGLEARREQLETDLRLRFSGQDRAGLSEHPVLKAYQAYYRRFRKSYHVQLQLESILWKGKSIPSVSALVEAMFMAEMKNLLLTAGHDLDVLRLPLRLDVSTGMERYRLLRGDEQTLKPGDMLIRDRDGVVSSIIYGPDRRTRITAGTGGAVFTVYAPAGIAKQAVEAHLSDIHEYVEIFAPQARVELLSVFGTI